MSTNTESLDDDVEPVTDVIEALSLRYLNHLSDEIFSYLDYGSLKNSEMVSPVWYESIISGNMWKKLLQRNVQRLPEWEELLSIIRVKFPHFMEKDEIKDSSFYRTLCQAVGDRIQAVEENWKRGLHVRTQSHHFSQPALESVFWIPGSLTFEMNKKWIGRGQRDGNIILWDRWTWDLYEIFEPSLEVNGYYGSRTVRCLQFNDDILAAGYYGGEVCVWDINTTELLHFFNERDVIGRASHNIPFNGLSMAESSGCYLLLSSFVSPKRQDVITLREIGYPGTDDGVTVNRVLLDNHLKSKQIMVTTEHVFLQITNSRTKSDHIELRCPLTLDITKIIQLPHSGTCGFAHTTLSSQPVILTGSGRVLQLRNVVSGDLIRTFQSDSSILCVQFVGSNYFLTVTAIGNIEVWDSRPILQSVTNSSTKLVPILRFEALETNPPFLFPVVRADEYHIALIPDRNEDHTDLYFIDFLRLNEVKLE